jgi:hypothetical protein
MRSTKYRSTVCPSAISYRLAAISVSLAPALEIPKDAGFGAGRILLDRSKKRKRRKSAAKQRPMFQLFLSSSTPPDIVSRLQESIDRQEVDPYQPSLYRGERPIIGRVDGNDFHLRKRSSGLWYWNLFTPAFWFKPALHGTVSPKGNGSEVMIDGGAPLATKIGWALLFLGVATCFGLVVVFTYPVNINFDPAHAAFDMQLGLLLMNIALGILLLIPLVGWFFTRHELRYLEQELQSRFNLKPISKSAN